MKKKIIRILACVVVVCLMVVAYMLSGHKTDIGTCTEYECNVKIFRLTTTIEIDKEGKDFAKVSGNIFRFITDPLTMYDLANNKTAYADDSYHLIAQDSHSIYVHDIRTAEMVGLVKILGELYDIYDKDGEKIATVTFNTFNTNGEMYDIEGNLIADYNSKLYRKDFDVRIKENCEIDEKTVLMIFCSYYSDQNADSQSSSNYCEQ